MLSGQTFLITGATGRLGCDTVFRLEELGATVLPLVFNGYPPIPKRTQWAARATPILVESRDDLVSLPIPDYVIHLHWRVNRKLSYTEQVLFEIDCNIKRLAFFWLWIKDKPIKRFANLSSIKIFSQLNTNPISANSEPRPLSPYGICKLTAEKYLDAYFKTSCFLVTHLRLCSVASFGEHPSQFMSQLAASALTNERIRINAQHTSNIIYIDDAVDLIINAALSANKNRYIIANEAIPNSHIASEFERIAGCKLNAAYADLMPGVKDQIYNSDIPKLKADWGREVTLQAMIEKILALHNSSLSDTA